MTPIFLTNAGDFTWAIGQAGGEFPSTLTAVVDTPEPAALILLGLGLTLVFAQRRFAAEPVLK